MDEKIELIHTMAYQQFIPLFVRAGLAERRGADKVFLNAKIPDFYQKLGFEILQREKAPAISDCSTCSRYLHGCEPEIMVKKIS